MAIRGFLTAMVLALALCAPSAALSAESDWGAEGMTASVSLGIGRVDDANSYNAEFDFAGKRTFYGLGFFLIDNGNLPGGLRDYPPPGSVTTTDVGWRNDHETGGYIRIGRILSELRIFGTIGASDVTRKYVVKDTSSETYYVTDEKTEDFQMVYGAGIGYLISKRMLLQYQYDNRRKGLLMVGVRF